jgi:hypothetical protein
VNIYNLNLNYKEMRQSGATDYSQSSGNLTNFVFPARPMQLCD